MQFQTYRCPIVVILVGGEIRWGMQCPLGAENHYSRRIPALKGTVVEFYPLSGLVSSIRAMANSRCGDRFNVEIETRPLSKAAQLLVELTGILTRRFRTCPGGDDRSGGRPARFEKHHWLHEESWLRGGAPDESRIVPWAPNGSTTRTSISGKAV